MMEFLETRVDKFTFRVANDRYYASNGIWVKPEEGCLRIGVSDFLQLRSGDVAFTEVKPIGTQLAFGDEFGSIETIKVNFSLDSPVNGIIIATNTTLETSPELVNFDPYGEGWLILIDTSTWETDRTRLLDAPTYFERMRKQAEEETQ